MFVCIVCDQRREGLSEVDLPADPITAASILLRLDGPISEILALVAGIGDDDPLYVSAQHVRAVCALRDRDPQRAKTLLFDVLQRDASRVGAWVTLAQVAAALDMPQDLLDRLRGVALNAPPSKRTAFVTQLLRALDFANTEHNARKDAVFDGFLLPLLVATLDQGDMDTAINLETLLYQFYVKAREEEEHFARCMQLVAPLFTQSAQAWRDRLPPLPTRPLTAPYRIGFFIHNASMLAHIEVMLNTLKGYRSLPEQPFEARVYCFSGKSTQMEQALAGVGVRLVMLNEVFPETATSSWQRLLCLRELLSQEGVQELVWVSLVTMLPLAFGLRIAPVQTWFAMKYRNFSLEDIDGYVTGSAITRFGWLHGRRWRMGMLGVDDWFDPALTDTAAGIREQYAGKVILMTLGRTEKMQNTAYLTAVIELLRSNPDSVFLWAGREQNRIIQNAFEDGGVLEQTHYLGWVNTRLYAQVADIFIDSFPFPCSFTLFQAMAAGKPVVIYTSPEAAQTGLWSLLKRVIEDGEGDVDDVAEMMNFVGDPQCPLISIARTPQEYVALTQRLIRDTTAQSAAGLASYQFILRYFSDPSAMGRSLARHFVELIEERRDGRSGISLPPVL